MDDINTGSCLGAQIWLIYDSKRKEKKYDSISPHAVSLPYYKTLGQAFGLFFGFYPVKWPCLLQTISCNSNTSPGLLCMKNSLALYRDNSYNEQLWCTNPSRTPQRSTWAPTLDSTQQLECLRKRPEHSYSRILPVCLFATIFFFRNTFHMKTI